MLLVRRGIGEALRIGTDIEVKVVSFTRSQVMLAVMAPRELKIRRIYGKSDYKHGPDPDGSAAATDEPAEGTAAPPKSRKNHTPDE